MMLAALLLLTFQANARELQGKESVAIAKSRQPTHYYKPTYSSKLHYSTSVVNSARSKQKKVIPSMSKKYVNLPKTNIVIVEESENKSPIPVPSSKPSPTPVPETSNQTSPSPLPSPQVEPSKSPVPSPITPDEKTPSDSSPIVIPSPSPSPACFDNPPDAEYTCSEQASFGRCNATFLQGFCDKACGRC
eukprot:TRINITY_DN801_c0_g1_i2.p2 TRINITY_DN801_c0_g1~~TRINITY_DN801_c0_g1_i2.p2  ORF type:complete len:190 (-),score=24.52 TRINITY_DN801_c0_g1_i2:328-897(-)